MSHKAKIMRSASHHNSTCLHLAIVLFLVVISQQTVVGHVVDAKNDRQSAVAATGLRGAGPVGTLPMPETTTSDDTDTVTSRQLQAGTASSMSLSPLTITTDPPAESGTTPMKVVVGSEATFRIAVSLPSSTRRMTDMHVTDIIIDIYDQDEDKDEEGDRDLRGRKGGGLFIAPSDDEEEADAAAGKSLFRPATTGRGKPVRERTYVIDAVIFITETPSNETIRDYGTLEDAVEEEDTLRYSCIMSSLYSVGMWKTKVMVKFRWVNENKTDKKKTPLRKEDRRRLVALQSEWMEYNVVNAPTGPTASPSSLPSSVPTPVVSVSPTTSAMPTVADVASEEPSVSAEPSQGPSQDPTLSTRPSHGPSSGPSLSTRPSLGPSTSPTTSSRPSSVSSSSPTTSTAPSDGPIAPPSSSPSSVPSVSAQPSSTPSQSPTELCDISLSIFNLDDQSPTAVSSGSNPVNIWDWGYFEDGDRKPLYSAEYSDEGSNLTFWGEHITSFLHVSSD